MHPDIDYAQLVHAIGDGIVIGDPDGKIIFWNRGCERIFGFTEAEAMAASLDIIVPERLRQRHWDGWVKTMETGHTRYGNDVLRVPALHKDGSSLSIAFTVALLPTPEGKVGSIVAVIRDETKRFNEDRALRARLAELQAKVDNIGS